jgi:hypothetical protein
MEGEKSDVKVRNEEAGIQMGCIIREQSLVQPILPVREEL